MARTFRAAVLRSTKPAPARPEAVVVVVVDSGAVAVAVEAMVAVMAAVVVMVAAVEAMAVAAVSPKAAAVRTGVKVAVETGIETGIANVAAAGDVTGTTIIDSSDLDRGVFAFRII